MTDIKDQAEMLIADVSDLQKQVLRKHTVALIEEMQDVLSERKKQPDFTDLLTRIQEEFNQHKYWRYAEGTPLENDLAVRAATVALRYFGDLGREADD